MAERKRDREGDDPPVRQAARLEQTLRELCSEDPGVRADAVRLFCPCRSQWDVPVQRYVAAMMDDPSPSVRHEAHHVLDEDSRWGRKLADRRCRDACAAEPEDVAPGPHSLAWMRQRRPRVKGAPARLALKPPRLEKPVPKKDLSDEALDPFYEDGLISEVVGVVKSGKEATVYCCRAESSTGADYLAAKIYRPRHVRSFKNDAVYREGRVILDQRVRRAVQKKTRKGREFDSAMWVGHEFGTLTTLHAAGSDVPRPFSCASNAILMEYLGDGRAPAPMLGTVAPERNEARALFDTILGNIRLWLGCNVIHGDLSPFNILYCSGTVKIIDFPQAVDPRFNRNAYVLLERDVENVCGYFQEFGVRADPSWIMRDLWRGLVTVPARPRAV